MTVLPVVKLLASPMAYWRRPIRLYWKPICISTNTVCVPDMTYNVFGGTLSLTQSINQPPILSAGDSLRLLTTADLWAPSYSGYCRCPALAAPFIMAL